MRYLVTGGAGYLGAVICEQLLRGGDEVVAYDVTPGAVLPRLIGKERAREVTVRGDVTDGMHLLRTAKERGVDAIVHMAAVLGYALNSNPPRGIRINVMGTTNVLETARILGLRKVVYASSISVFRGYQAGEDVPNDARYQPINIYGGSKIMAELTASYYTQAYGLDTAGIRFSYMIGVARQFRASDSNAPQAGSGPVQVASIVPDFWKVFLRELIEKPCRGEPGRVPFGDDVANWLAVEDAARAVVLAARSGPTPSRAFNISGDVRPIGEAVSFVRQLIPGAEISAEPGRHDLQESPDASVLERELGFKLAWRMEDQIAALIEHARA